MFFSTSEKSSHPPISVTFSTEEALFFVIFLNHIDAFAPSWHKFKNFCHDGKRHLTYDEVCDSFDCSKKECCSAVRTNEATFGNLQILEKMGKRKWLFVNGCEYKVLISVMTDFLNQYQFRTAVSVC